MTEAGTDPSHRPRPHSPGRDWVALTLAVGLATALNAVTIAVLIDALWSENAGLSENATQLLVAGFGGITGILGSYVGAGIASRARQEQRDQADPAQGETL